MGKYIDIPVKYIVLSCIGSTHTLRAAALPRDVSPHLPLQLATGGELIDPVTPKWGDFWPPFLFLKQQASSYWPPLRLPLGEEKHFLFLKQKAFLYTGKPYSWLPLNFRLNRYNAYFEFGRWYVNRLKYILYQNQVAGFRWNMTFWERCWITWNQPGHIYKQVGSPHINQVISKSRCDHLISTRW